MEIDTKKLVWAKQRGSPYWPAIIVDDPPPEVAVGDHEDMVYVMFFGTHNFGWIRVENIEEYIPNREKYEARYKLAGIKKAMKEMNDFIANPDENHWNAYPKIGKVRVKLEKENEDDEQQYVQYDSPSKVEKTETGDDKKRLINELLSIKKKHSDTSFELVTTKRTLEAKEQELAELKKKYSKMCDGTMNRRGCEDKAEGNETLALKPEIDSIKNRLIEAESDLKSKSKIIETMKSEMVTLRNDNKDWIDGFDKQLASKTKSCEDEMLRLKAKTDSFETQLKQIGIKFPSNTGELEVNNVSQEDIHQKIDELKQQYATETMSHGNEKLRLNAEIESVKNQLKKAELDLNSKLEAKELEKVNLSNVQQKMIDELKAELASKINSRENEMLRLKAEAESAKNQLAQDTSCFELKLKAKELETSSLSNNHQKLIDELNQQFASKTELHQSEILNWKSELKSLGEKLAQSELKLKDTELKMDNLQSERQQKIAELKTQYASETESHGNEKLRLNAEIESVKNQLKEAELDFNSKLEAKELEKVNLSNGQQKMIDELKAELASKINSRENEMLRLKAEAESAKNQLAQDTSCFELKLKAKELETSSLSNNHQKLIDELNQQFASKTELHQSEILNWKSELKSLGEKLAQSELKLKDTELKIDNLQSERQQKIAELKTQYASETESHGNEKLRLNAEIESVKNQLKEAELDFNSKLEAKELEKVNLSNGQQKMIDELKAELASKINSRENEMLRLESETKSFEDESNEAKLDTQLKTKKRPGQTAKKGNFCTPKRARKEKNDDVFEVEQLLDHKMENGKWMYLVRWESYGPEDDSWESESNLLCPQILTEYKRQKMAHN